MEPAVKRQEEKRKEGETRRTGAEAQRLPTMFEALGLSPSTGRWGERLNRKTERQKSMREIKRGEEAGGTSALKGESKPTLQAGAGETGEVPIQVDRGAGKGRERGRFEEGEEIVIIHLRRNGMEA